jgi:hypothetical protein
MNIIAAIQQRMLEIMIASGGAVGRKKAIRIAVKEVGRVEALKAAVLPPKETKPVADDGDPDNPKRTLIQLVNGIAERLRSSQPNAHSPPAPPVQQPTVVRANPPPRAETAPARASESPGDSSSPPDPNPLLDVYVKGGPAQLIPEQEFPMVYRDPVTATWRASIEEAERRNRERE